MRASHVLCAITSIAGVLAFASGPAQADIIKDQCIDANGRGQELRREAKLAAAREELQACASPACPTLVRDDCTLRLDELDKVQPTIVFEVKDASGSDVSAVNVTVDDKPLTEKLDGTALPVDMGEHVFRFEIAGQPPILRTLIVAEGEKARRERIVLGAAATFRPNATLNEVNAISPSSIGSPTSDPAAADGGGRTQKVLGLVAGGSSVVAFAVGGIFAGIASSRWATAQRECPTYTGCSQAALSEHNDAAGSATVSTVSFIAGGILVATGVTLLLTAPKANQASVGFAVGPGGVGLVGTL